MAIRAAAEAADGARLTDGLFQLACPRLGTDRGRGGPEPIRQRVLLELVRWARRWRERTWALEDCRIRELTAAIDALEREIRPLAGQVATTLLAFAGCGPLTAAKLVRQTGGIGRFRSRAAFARHNGTAPVPVCRATRSVTGSTVAVIAS